VTGEHGPPGKRSRPAANGAARLSTTVAASSSMSLPAGGLPVAVIVRVAVDRRGVRSVEIRCPYGCRNVHTHGWPPGHRWPGSRVAHCADGPGRGASYEIGRADCALAGTVGAA
jgi:hypothetical protein